MYAYRPERVMDFGRYQGKSFGWLVENDPAYLRWAADNMDDADTCTLCGEALKQATDEYCDDDDTLWLPSIASHVLVCSFCDGAIDKDDRLLEADDGRRIHLDCWDGHWGFTHAMNKDD